MKVAQTLLDFCMEDWGEDRLYSGGNLFCVIDGATPISKQPFKSFHSSAEWMAQGLVGHLAAGQDSGLDFPAVCRAFIESNRGVLAASFPDEYDLPCLTTATVLENDGILKGWVLGDCSIYILMKDGCIQHVTDQRTAEFYQKTLRAGEEARRMGLDVKQAIRQQRIKNKAAMNRPGGYWTVGYIGAFEGMFRRFSVGMERVEAVLLCTDGFDRLFSMSEISPGELLQERLSLKKAASLLRAEEEKTGNPHVKKHDDAAAMLLVRR